MTRTRQSSTAMGLAAMLIWSSTIAVSRSLAECVGSMTAGAWAFLSGGLIGCLYAAVAKRSLRAMLRLPRKYLLGAGALFMAYMTCLYAAIGLSSSRQQTLEVGILNYLWPGMTLVLAIPILHWRVRRTFAVGVIVAIAGVALAPLHFGEYSVAALCDGLRSNPWPYALGLLAAVLWALYSTLSRRWAGNEDIGAVPLFAVAAGLALGVLALWFPHPAVWSNRAIVEIAFMALFPTLVAYGFWDRAVRRGNITLVVSASYSIPVLSTFISSMYLDVSVGWNLWVGCGAIALGAVVCERSVVRPDGEGRGRS